MNVFGGEQDAITMIGLLVEKLGGSVTLTSDEVLRSLTHAGATLYVEVNLSESVHIEVIPRRHHGAADEDQANHTRL